MRRPLLIAAFIATLLLVLIGGHLYLAHRLVLAPALPEPWRTLGLALIAAGALLLVLQPIAERALPRRAGLWVAWPASLWMGFAFLLMMLSLATTLGEALMGAAY